MVESSGVLRDADLRGDGIRPYAQVSRLAVVSLVLALLGFLIVPIPFAVLFGILSIRRIRSSKGALAGMPVAVGGLVVAVAMVGAWGVYLRVQAGNRQRAATQCTESVRQFFDWLVRGYPEDAFVLLSEAGQERYKKALPPWGKEMAQLGRLDGVEFLKAAWKGKDAATMGFVVRFSEEEFGYEVVVVREQGVWRLDGFNSKWRRRRGEGAAAPEPPAGQPEENGP